MKVECEYATRAIDPDTLDETYVCDIDGHYCKMACPNKYKCNKTSATKGN